MPTASERGWPTVYPHLRYVQGRRVSRDFIRQRVPEVHLLDAVPYPWLAGSISMAVIDVDARYRVAVAEGAITLDAPTDQPWGIGTYAALDLEGHQWQFAQQLRPVAPKDWAAARR